MKICSQCRLEKPLTEFYKNKRASDNLNYSCKICFKSVVKKRADFLQSQKPKRVNKTDNPDYNKEYWLSNKKKLSDKQKEYYSKNKEKLLLRNKEYYEKNKKFLNKQNDLRSRKRAEKCDLFKSKIRIKNLIRTSVKDKGYTKRSSAYEILGCDYEFFKDYIKSQFKKGMDWGNIHLDHIKPLDSATTEEEVLQLNHYTNFQPLFAIDNLKKGTKLITKQIKLL